MVGERMMKSERSSKMVLLIQGGGLSCSLVGKESACQCRRCKRQGFNLWVGKIPWRRKWQPMPVFLPGKSHGQWSLVDYSPPESRTRLSDFTLFFHFHALEKEMASQSSVLAWRIPGTGEPGELPSMGLHRVGHD